MKGVSLLFRLIIIYTFFGLAFLSCKKETTNSPVNITPTPTPTNKMCEPEIIAYNFGVDNFAPSKQVHILDSAGMHGIFFEVPPFGGIQKLKAFQQTTEVIDGNFTISDVFVYLSLTDSAQKKQQIQLIEDVYKEIQFRDTQLQVIFLGPNEDPTNAIIQVAEIAKSYNKDLLIYPHYETSTIASAEDALTYIQAVQKENVFLAVHLCHELAAGNATRMDEVVANVKPFIKSVSVSGASMSEFGNTTLPAWYWGIKPLYMGDYDLTQFYQALYNMNYDGPLAIHTWGIFNNFGLTPEEHLPLSKAVIEGLAEGVCK